MGILLPLAEEESLLNQVKREEEEPWSHIPQHRKEAFDTVNPTVKIFTLIT